MTKPPLQLLPPDLDPAPIFEIFRGNFAMELLTAAVAHFGVAHGLQKQVGDLAHGGDYDRDRAGLLFLGG